MDLYMLGLHAVDEMLQEAARNRAHSRKGKNRAPVRSNPLSGFFSPFGMPAGMSGMFFGGGPSYCRRFSVFA